MNIRDKTAYDQSFWDWSIFNECFGTTKIKLTDIDGMVERKGHILLVETKGKDVLGIPDGQKYLFQALLKTGVFTIWILYGDPHTGDNIGVWSPNSHRLDVYREGTLWNEVDKFFVSLSDLQGMMSQWFEIANR